MARRYARDNRGRFAPKGAGATARGGRLKTAGGNKRATQTMQASAAPKGTIGKPKGLKPGAVKAKPQTTAKTPLKRTGQRTAVPVMKTNTERGRQGIVSMSANAKQARRGAVAERKAEKQARISERATGIVARRQGRREMTYNPDGSFNQSAARLNQTKEANSKRLQRWLTTRDPATKPVSKAKPAAKPAGKRKAVGSISEAKAARIVARIDANRPARRRVAGSLRKSNNASRTHQRATEFALAAANRARKRGTPISVNQSVQRAVANASKKRRR